MASGLLRGVIGQAGRIGRIGVKGNGWGAMCLSATSQPSTAAAKEKPAKGESGSEESGSGQGQGTDGDRGGRRRRVMGAPVSWGSLALALGTGSALYYVYTQEIKRKIASIRSEGSAGEALLGGPFSLIDENGKRFTQENLKGQWNMLYFGFTYCPDICPTELEKLADAVDALEKRGINVVPIFLSIDPKRDTVKQVKAYTEEFHPKMRGLTGSVEECVHAARQYRVYYSKTLEDEDGDYLVDHSIIMYLVNPRGEFVKFFGKNETVESLTNATEGFVKAFV